MKRLLKWMLYAFAGFVVLIAVAVALAPAPNTNPVAQKEPEPKQQQPAPQEKEQEQQPEPEPKPEEQGPQDYLKVTGTAGIPFSCAVMDGDMDQRTVDGNVPQTIPLKDMGFGAMSENQCQKSGAKGTLTVAIVVGEDEQDTNTTSAAYGIASVGNPN